VTLRHEPFTRGEAAGGSTGMQKMDVGNRARMNRTGSEHVFVQ
jgi:hypothetical protein